MERRIHATFEESRLTTSDFGRSYLGNTAAYQTCTWNMYVTSESENKQISRHHPQPRWKHAERMAIWSQFCSLEKKYVIRLTYRSFASIMRIVNDEQRRFQTKVIRLFEIIYVFLTIFLYLLKCPQSLILSALRAFCFCGKPHISRSIFLYFRYQAWLKSW